MFALKMIFLGAIALGVLIIGLWARAARDNYPRQW